MLRRSTISIYTFNLTERRSGENSEIMADQTQELEYIAVAQVGDLEPGTMMHVDVMGEEIALFNTDGEIYAIGDVCTHAYTHLTEGDFYEDIRGWVVECP